MNRAVVACTLLLPPAVALAGRAPGAWARRIVRPALIGVMLTAAWLSDSQSAQLALLVGGLTWLVFPLFRWRAAQTGLIVLICAGMLGGPWLAQFLYDTLAASLHTRPWFSDGYAADRLEIWDFIARKALENPLYGFGIEATRHIEHFDTKLLYTPLDHVLHPHNAVLQIWIEFGLAGIAGACAALAGLVRGIFRVEDPQARRLCLSVLAMVLVTACVAYGLWQSWWLGLLTLSAGLCAHLAAAAPPAAGGRA